MKKNSPVPGSGGAPARAGASAHPSDAYLRQIVDGIADVVFEVSMDGTLTYLNSAAQALSGWTPDELIGKSAYQLLDAADHEDVRRSLDAGSAGLMVPHEYRIRIKSGESIWVRVHGRPVVVDGRIVAVRGVIADITERVRARDALDAQRQFSESLLDTAQVIVLVLDPEGRVERVNRCLEMVSGFGANEVLGTSWIATCVPDLDREKARTLFAIAPSDAGVRKGFVRVRTKAGELRAVEWHTSNVRDAKGRITGTIAVGTDITESRRAEEALRESEAKYRAIFENLHDTYFRTDLEDNIVMASPSGEHIFGYKVDEAIGLNMTSFYVDLKKRDAVLKMMSEKGYVREFEAELRRKDGSIIWVSSNATFWRDKDGNIGGVEGVTRDITERKRAEAETARLEEQLRHAQKMEAIGTLAGGIAHDFNNLLTSILGCANMLKSSMRKEDKGYSAVDVIERAAVRASDLTKQLLGFARKGKLKNTPVDMHAVIADTIAIVDRTIERTIAIERKLVPSRPVVMGDETQLQQVVMNLAVNARDAMPEGGRMTVETRVESLDDEYCRAHPEFSPGAYLVLAVTDTGSGIPEEIRGRVFEPFFTTKPLGVGTGMGLATVYGIVKNHGGTVTFQTEEGTGTTFLVHLPLCAGDVTVAEAPAPGVLAHGSARILVVDDEDTVRETVEMMLTMLGYRVDTAANGAQAVEKFRSTAAETSLVILDMTMPQMNGRECFKQLRQIDPNVKVLLSTGHAIEGEAQELVAAGMVGLVQKPYIAPQLADAVASALATA